MKWIKYQILQSVVDGQPVLANKKVGYDDAHLVIAQNEAYNGQYEIFEDGTPEPPAGIVPTNLSDAVDSTSGVNDGVAATPAAVKQAYDKANHSHPYLPLVGGTMTGNVRIMNNNPYVSLRDSGTGEEAYMQTYTENGVLHVGFGYGWDASLKISRHGQALANANGQTPGASVLRNSKLVSAEENPTVNGEICWTYE